MRFIVIGGSGFVGIYTIKALLEFLGKDSALDSARESALDSRQDSARESAQKSPFGGGSTRLFARILHALRGIF